MTTPNIPILISVAGAIENVPSPAPVFGLSPEPNSVLVACTPVADAATYRVGVCEDGDVKSIAELSTEIVDASIATETNDNEMKAATSNGAIYLRAAGLRPNTRYWLWVRAENSSGHSDWSRPVRFATSADSPKLVAQRADPSRPGTLAVAWEIPRGSRMPSVASVTLLSDSGAILRPSESDYTVEVHDRSWSHSVNNVPDALRVHDWCYVTVSDLPPDTRFQIGVSVRGEVFPSPSKPTVAAFTGNFVSRETDLSRLLQATMPSLCGVIPPIASIIAEFVTGPPFPQLPPLPSDYVPNNNRVEHAVPARSSNKLRYLLDHERDVTFVSCWQAGYLGPYDAAEKGDLAFVQLLLSRGARVVSGCHIPGHIFSCVLHSALSKGHAHIAHYLLDFHNNLTASNIEYLKKSIPNPPLRLCDVVMKSDTLSLALSSGCISVARRLILDYGLPHAHGPSWPSGEGHPLAHLLQMAMKEQWFKAVQFLVEEMQTPFELNEALMAANLGPAASVTRQQAIFVKDLKAWNRKRVAKGRKTP